MTQGPPRALKDSEALFYSAPLPSAQIVMLTIHEDDAHRADATTAGASAYVPKRVMQTELIPTLAALLANDRD